MTLTLNLNAEEEARLKAKAEVLGLAPEEYIRNLINGEQQPQTTGDRVRAVLGDRPAGSGQHRWSEVEAACDPD